MGREVKPGCPKRVGSLHPWKYSKPSTTWSEATCCSWLCLKSVIFFVICRGRSQGRWRQPGYCTLLCKEVLWCRWDTWNGSVWRIPQRTVSMLCEKQHLLIVGGPWTSLWAFWRCSSCTKRCRRFQTLSCPPCVTCQAFHLVLHSSLSEKQGLSSSENKSTGVLWKAMTTMPVATRRFSRLIFFFFFK